MEKKKKKKRKKKKNEKKKNEDQSWSGSGVKVCKGCSTKIMSAWPECSWENNT